MTSRSVMHKTRLFGQSHWVNSIVGFRDIFEMIDQQVTDTAASKVYVDMQRLKHLGRIIKALRVGSSWPSPSMSMSVTQGTLTTSSSSDPHKRYGLPSRQLADELVACYLRSTESLYRILHVPLFQREYDALWTSLNEATTNSPLTKADMAFVVQLKLVLAIGAATHPSHIDLRTRAIHWFHAAQAWIAEPEYKSHLTIQALQIQILLLFAREATGIGGALIWISVGDLLRSAVYMGLHRDPDHLPKRMTVLAAEMRRRIWNTILEVVVSTSLDAGGPVMLSDSDFDTRPPSNCGDEQLDESVLAQSTGSTIQADIQANNKASAETPTTAALTPASQTARPLSEFTSMSVAIALRETLSLRLTVCKVLNDMGPPCTYADALRLDRRFRAAYRNLTRTLQQYTAAATAAAADTSEQAGAPKTIDHYTVALVHLAMRRYLLCLHIPFFGASLHEKTTYAYSRSVVCDTAVRLWQACCPGIVDASVPTADAAEFAANEAKQTSFEQKPGRTLVDPEIVRQALLGAGALRRLSMQASLLVAAEAKFQLIEDDDLGQNGRTPIRQDLMAIIQTALHWSLRGIEAGETNFKGYLLWNLIDKQLDGMRRGMMAAPTASAESRMTLARELVAAAEQAEAECTPIFEAMLARGQQQAHDSALQALALPSGGHVVGYGGAASEITPVETFGPELYNLVRMCRIKDCPCQAIIHTQQQDQQQQQALAAAQLAEHHHNLQSLSMQQPLMPDIQQPLDPMAVEFAADSWDLIMPEAQSLNIGSGEPLSWLFGGETAQGILW
ncbi:hypothetical protein SEPCBS119000_004126 [Sporothrix epigloea]|uniref:Xylanolytic transcriptional activator regulatory domain-containing protein n=1 Tax=Sporothrix epigloea TaxID=1892477 RepID=A0ABP0DT87_9PEZI